MVGTELPFMLNIDLVTTATLFVYADDLEGAALGGINLYVRSLQEQAELVQMFLHSVPGVAQEHDIVRKYQAANFPLSQVDAIRGVNGLYEIIHCDIK